jgi:hypothetical protein
MTVRGEIAQSRCETGMQSPGDRLCRLRQCLSRFRDGYRRQSKKGASPQQYVEGPSGEPVGR